MNLTRLAYTLACVATLLNACGGGSDASNAAVPPPASGTTAPPPPDIGAPPPPPPSSDTSAPTVTLTAPVALAPALTGNLLLTASATDDGQVAGVEFQVDGVRVDSEDTSAPFSVGIDTAAYAAGQHVVRARARDAAGNLSAWSSATVRFAGATEVNAGFTKNETWVDGLVRATAFAEAPDGRWFIAQQDGAVRIVKNGALLPAPFLQLTNIDANGERGLIGLALDPGFASNGYVYLHYTSTAGGTHNRISRFTALGDFAPGGETPLVDLPTLSTATNHNGGAIHFGSDGKLYVGVGDNADGSRSPLLNDPFGKLLRFNADGSIPADNPHYATQTGLARAIWARGLRNPFTFAVQPGTGRIHINDVGAGTWEEINLGSAGADHGWPTSEGPVSGGTATGPLFAYRHSEASPAGSGPGGFLTGQSIAGGAFYPASGPFPASYRGNYFFADYVSKFVARLDAANGNAVYAFAWVGGNPVDMGVGADGALYVLTRGGITKISAP